MPFSNTPVVSTYSTHPLPAMYDYVGSIEYTQNIIPVKMDDGQIMGETRYSISGTRITSNGNTEYCRGMYVWEKTAGTIYYFMVVHDDVALTSKVYSSTNSTTWAAVNTLGTDATTPVRFTEFIDATNTKKLVMVDGLEGYVFTTNAAGTKIVDADFPSPHVPFPVFLDGYLFLAKAGTGDIYNSDLNDPAVWTAGNFISAEMYPDDIQALLKINNYLVAVGTQSSEYFYDAANATASPLARIESATVAFGTSFPNSIAVSKDTAIFLANSNDGETCIRQIVGTSVKDILGPFIPSLASSLQAGSLVASDLRACFIRQRGGLYYCISFGGSSYLYSLEFSMWLRANSLGGALPVFFSAPATSKNAVTYVAGHAPVSLGYSTAYFGTLNPLSLWANNGSGTSYVGDMFDGSSGARTAISQGMVTSMNNYGTLNQKFMSRFGINFMSSNYAPSDPAESFTVQIYDAGQNGSIYTSQRTLAKDFGFPFITQLGKFRQRYFSVIYGGNFFMRWFGFEVDINKGQQ